MNLGTKLMVYLSLVIVLILTGYGYLDILSRRDLLIRKMKDEVRSTGRTLETTLEKIFPGEDPGDIQNLIDALSEPARTLGIIVYDGEKNRLFRSRFFKDGKAGHFPLIQRAMAEDRAVESFGVYEGIPYFSYTAPLKDGAGKTAGALAILQQTSYVEEEIAKAKWNIGVITSLLILGTVALVLWGTQKWVARPISRLMTAIENLSAGNLQYRVDLPGGGEIAVLAGAFNQMAEELKKARERLIREGEARLDLERTLLQSEKLATVGQLASELAHEIGTPLNIIYGRSEMIQRKLEDREEIGRNAAIIRNQTERITRIVRQLLDVARKKKAEHKPFPIVPVLEAVLDFLDHQTQKRQVRVEKNWQAPLPPVVGDADQIQQVFLNLILNALQAMPGGGTLRLSAVKRLLRRGLEETPRPYTEVSVEDSGTGMEKDVLENLFRPFFTGKEGGTGLGLTVSQGIVQEHEGWIEVESKPGKGSIFRVYLPSPREAALNGTAPA